MHEVCFCGWAGRVEDRTLVYAGDGEWGLECPKCGRMDRIDWLQDLGRIAVLDEAARQSRGGDDANRALSSTRELIRDR